MIRNTLLKTQQATFCVELPSAEHHGMPVPTGTGFFVSPDGWFVTAAHVITSNNEANGPVRGDLNQVWLTKETRVPAGMPGSMCQAVSFGHILPNLDFALLKVDYAANANKAWLSGQSEFPYIEVSAYQPKRVTPSTLSGIHCPMPLRRTWDTPS